MRAVLATGASVCASVRERLARLCEGCGRVREVHTYGVADRVPQMPVQDAGMPPARGREGTREGTLRTPEGAQVLQGTRRRCRGRGQAARALCPHECTCR